MITQSILKVIMAVGLLDVTSTPYAAEGIWSRKADMPTRRLGLSTSVVNGKLYAIGGGYSIEGSHSRIVEEYDPVTDSWTRKADIPTGRIPLTIGELMRPIALMPTVRGQVRHGDLQQLTSSS